jgi:hypothetical protein
VTLATQIEADNSAVFLNAAEFAQSVTVTPAGGAPVALTAIVEDEDVSDSNVDLGVQQERRCRVTVNMDPAAESGGIADPKLNDTITIGSEDWNVESIDKSSGLATYAAVRPAVRERSTTGYRG